QPSTVDSAAYESAPDRSASPPFIQVQRLQADAGRHLIALPPSGADDSSGPTHNTETYDHIVENAFLDAREQPLSTFAIDVDTASYANVRRFLNQHTLPPAGAVRIEELVNYFRYDYAPPTG